MYTSVSASQRFVEVSHGIIAVSYGNSTPAILLCSGTIEVVLVRSDFKVVLGMVG